MPYLNDRVKETTTSTGTGAITLAGAVADFRSFATAFGSSTIGNVPYCIDDGAGNWEVGLGTFNGTTGLTRDRVYSSSNSGALVSFAAGTKTVFHTLPADTADSGTWAQTYMAARAMALP